MLSARAKRQLLVFVAITLIGVSYVGARYARLDTLVWDTSYEVTATFAQSGGIFTGAEVTYRGVKIGTVSDMRIADAGVDVILDIDNEYDQIPAATTALVGNKSAVGEQYVELDPASDTGPYLGDGSVIGVQDTRTPVPTTEILTNLDKMVTSVPIDSLRTTVTELGSAFNGTGSALGEIIDTSNEFIDAANDNFDVTKALIRDSNTVLRTQADKGSAIRSFARDLQLFSGVVADNDRALRRLIASGAATADQLRSFLEENQVDLGSLINNLVTTGEIVSKHLPGIRQVLTIFPYQVASGFTVTAKSPGGYNARFGFILNQIPAVCHEGYDPDERRSPTDGENRPMDADAHCASPPSKTNARGAQNAPRAAASYDGAAHDVASYDLATGKLTWNDAAAPPVVDSGSGPSGGWEMLLLAPVG